MLTGKELGKAIEIAIHLKLDKGVVKSKAEIARHFGIQPPSIHDWIKKGSISKDKLPELWSYFSDVVTHTHWGLTGDELVYVVKSTLETRKSHMKNVEPGPEIYGMIPLISWVQAGKFCSSPDLFYPGDGEQMIPCPRKVGKRTYALRVKGDSMVSDKFGEKSYPEGIIIYVDPDKEVTNGCKVVARIHSEEEATFKKYSEDAGRKYLRPLNKDYDPILMDDTMHICGVVVGSWMDE